MAAAGVSRLPPREISEFANSLYEYLYVELEIQNAFGVRGESVHFKEVIGRAVLAFERKTVNFNRELFERGGFSFHYVQNILELCNLICTMNRDDSYFKKLFYVSAFILDVIYWWDDKLQNPLLFRGPELWLTVFKNNFESEFESNGGWAEMEVCAERCFEMTQNQILMEGDVLPKYFSILTSAVREFNAAREAERMRDFSRLLEDLRFGDEEDETSVEAVPTFQPEVERLVEEIRQPQPEVERLEEIQQPQPVGEASVQPSPQIPGPSRDVVQDPFQDTSQNYEEVAPQSQVPRRLRKRRFAALPERIDSDSEDESTLPSKSKVDRK